MKTYSVTLLFITALALPTQAQVAVSPDPVVVTQPDNTLLTLVGKGTPARPYTETIDGYTVLRNSKGYYVYAYRNKEQQLVAGKKKAHNPPERGWCERRYLKKLTKHLRSPEP